MRVLVACEFSGIVRDAFIAAGHDAVSCDLLPSETPGPHYQGDVRAELLVGAYDLVIAHPPCTYLANSGVRWLYGGKGTERDAVRWAQMQAAAGPALRSMLGSGWRGSVVTVEGPAGAAVTVTLSDWCACGERHGLPTLIDLSREAFSQLAHPSAGVVAVSIEIGAQPARLPETDQEAPR